MADRSRLTDALLTISEHVRSAPDGEQTRLLDVLQDTNGRTRADLRRALVDVKTTDVPGVASPAVLPLPVAPTRPLLAMSRSFGDLQGSADGGGRVKYQVPVVTGMPTANVDVPEKTDPTQTGKLTIEAQMLTGHTVDVRVDVSVLAAANSQQADAIDAQLTMAVAAAAEAAMVADLVAAAGNTATDLLDAVATALGFGAPVTVIADAGAWAGAASTLAPLVQASPGSIVLIPVGGTTAGTVVAPAGDLVLYVDDVFRQRVADVDRLGWNVSLSLHVLAAVGHPAYASKIAATP